METSFSSILQVSIECVEYCFSTESMRTFLGKFTTIYIHEFVYFTIFNSPSKEGLCENNTCIVCVGLDISFSRSPFRTFVQLLGFSLQSSSCHPAMNNSFRTPAHPTFRDESGLSLIWTLRHFIYLMQLISFAPCFRL